MRYEVIILDVESLLPYFSQEEISQALEALEEKKLRPCKLEDLFGPEDTFFQSDQEKLISTIKQLLGQEKTTGAILVSAREEVLKAADQVKCLTLGIKDSPSDFTFDEIESLHKVIDKINTTFAELKKAIMLRKEEDGPLLVGINGVDTSGKSQLSRELTQYFSKQGLASCLIHLDDYHNKAKVRYANPDPIASYYEHAFNLERLLEELIKPIKENKVLFSTLKHLDLETDDFTKEVTYKIDPNTIVFIEGVLLFRAPLDDYLDMRIFLEISFDEVLKRASIRDGHLFGDQLMSKYKEKYIPVQQSYLTKEKPREKCHILIDNHDYHQPVILKNILQKERRSRAKLSPLRKDHQNILEDLHQDPVVATMLGVIDRPRLEDYEKAKAYVIEDNKGQVLGLIELFNISWHNRKAELSMLVHRDFRQQGYGQEALKEILRIGFEDLGLYRIWLRVLEVNQGAISLYEKVGFQKEGYCRGESLRQGRFLHQVQMSLLYPEWVNRR